VSGTEIQMGWAVSRQFRGGAATTSATSIIVRHRIDRILSDEELSSEGRRSGYGQAHDVDRGRWR
jgi:hypothetical protein